MEDLADEAEPVDLMEDDIRMLLVCPTELEEALAEDRTEDGDAADDERWVEEETVLRDW